MARNGSRVVQVLEKHESGLLTDWLDRQLKAPTVRRDHPGGSGEAVRSGGVDWAGASRGGPDSQVRFGRPFLSRQWFCTPTRSVLARWGCCLTLERPDCGSGATIPISGETV